jgi:predicted dehydrogenase
MADDTIRIGFVGAGANTELRHFPGLQAIEGVEFVSVANRSVASGQRIADKWGIPNVYDNWVDLIEADDTDAICIGTWPYTHRTMVVAALMAGKHVQTEARMTLNSDDAKEMLAASQDSPGLVAQIVPAPMTLPVDETIKDLIADGYLGDILSIDMNVSASGFVNPSGPFHWRHDRDMSGNNIMQMGIWYEGMMRWVGPAEAVSAVGRVHVKHRQDDTGARRHITIPDHVEILAEMASGPVARIKVSTITGHAPSPSVWIFGSEGTLHLDIATMTLSGGQRGDDGLSVIEIPDEKRGGWRVEEEFINAIRGIEPITHTNFYDGVRYMEFTDAVTLSIQTGERIQLPL